MENPSRASSSISTSMPYHPLSHQHKPFTLAAPPCSLGLPKLNFKHASNVLGPSHGVHHPYWISAAKPKSPKIYSKASKTPPSAGKTPRSVDGKEEKKIKENLLESTDPWKEKIQSTKWQNKFPSSHDFGSESYKPSSLLESMLDV
ncbi:hypothetical protein DVH24_007499 [Malus domestica]|uniref:Uncharacterized protein n=1 Tax=Malus domestica TaxID=3750 RepID=A0A498HMV0_MALDO|nr:hypothetical protein DVH24_007499 [Malus domestica]